MRGLRRLGVEREAERLAAAFEEACRRVEGCEAEIAVAAEALAAERQALALAVAVGELSLDGFAEREASVERTHAAAVVARDRAAMVLDAVRGPAADAHEAAARRRVEAVSTEVEQAAERLAEARALVEEREHDHAGAVERLESEKRLAIVARAPFDPEVARRAETMAEQEEEQARWHAFHSLGAEPVPAYLRARVAELQAERRAQVAAERERAKLASDRVPPEVWRGPGSLGPGEAFPRLGESL